MKQSVTVGAQLLCGGHYGCNNGCYGCTIVMSYIEVNKAVSQWLLTFNLCISVTWPLTCAFHIPCTHTPEIIDMHRGVCDNVSTLPWLNAIRTETHSSFVNDLHQIFKSNLTSLITCCIPCNKKQHIYCNCWSVHSQHLCIMSHLKAIEAYYSSNKNGIRIYTLTRALAINPPQMSIIRVNVNGVCEVTYTYIIE